jgi:hypothetical protein
MARMIIEGIVDTDSAAFGNNSGIILLLSVTHADGRPYTGLQSQNFDVQVMWNWLSGVDTKVFMFFEEDKNSFMKEHIPGIYALVLNNVQSTWGAIVYTAIVKVTEPIAGRQRNYGQTLLRFKVPGP